MRLRSTLWRICSQSTVKIQMSGYRARNIGTSSLHSDMCWMRGSHTYSFTVRWRSGGGLKMSTIRIAMFDGGGDGLSSCAYTGQMRHVHTYATSATFWAKICLIYVCLRPRWCFRPRNISETCCRFSSTCDMSALMNPLCGSYVGWDSMTEKKNEEKRRRTTLSCDTRTDSLSNSGHTSPQANAVFNHLNVSRYSLKRRCVELIRSYENLDSNVMDIRECRCGLALTMCCRTKLSTMLCMLLLMPISPIH